MPRHGGRGAPREARGCGRRAAAAEAAPAPRRRSRLPGPERAAVLALAGGRCAYCGERGGKGGLTVDHVEPLSLGGPDTPANMLPACWRCNQAKRDMRLEEFRAARGGGAFWFEEAGREPGAGGEA